MKFETNQETVEFSSKTVIIIQMCMCNKSRISNDLPQICIIVWSVFEYTNYSIDRVIRVNEPYFNAMSGIGIVLIVHSIRTLLKWKMYKVYSVSAW